MICRVLKRARTLPRQLASPVTCSHRLFSDTAAVKTSKPKAHLCDGPSDEHTMEKGDMMDAYKKMITIRRLEIAADKLYKQRMIRGFCHLYDGQEAVGLGIEKGINETDHLITAYRCHAQQFLRGDSILSIISELLGKRSGCARGKGGSMHMYLPEKRFYGGNGIVGAQVPVGAGLAFASKYKDDGTISVAMYGDGAANQGQIAEARNMAKLWDLPVVFVCENNQYGMGTSTDRAAAQKEFYLRGGYVPGIQTDGMDYIASKAAMEYAAKWCRDGNGPMNLEFKTYRYHGHSMSDPGKSYRSRDEVSGIRENRDCVEMQKKRILDQKWSTKEELKEMERSIRKEIDEAIEIAKQDTTLTEDEMFTDIYTDGIPPHVRVPNLSASHNASS